MKPTDYKKNIRRLFIVWFALFFALIIWIANYVYNEAPGIVANPYNRRIHLVAERVTRGVITDKNGLVLAHTNGGVREYPYGEALAHAVGFAGVRGQGAETVYSTVLLTVAGELMARLNAVYSGDTVMGNTLVTTLDAELCKIAYELLGGKKGSVIAIDPRTGEVVVSVSSVSFNPAFAADMYEELAEDTNLPLLNRASQGLYPPGSVYKIITLTAAMRHMPNFEDFTFNCTGSLKIEGKPLRCYNETAHGEVDIYSAFAMSCNGFFAQLADIVGAQALIDTANELLFNTRLPYPLEYSASSHVLTNTALPAELAETSIGQGRTMATPMHFALLTAAIANNGVLCEPHIVYRIEDASGNVIKRADVNKTVLFTKEEADVLAKAMRQAVTDGTASLMGTEIAYAAKTGSAENPHGAEHGWVAAFAPFNDPELVVVVMLENCGGSRFALEPAALVLKNAVMSNSQ